MSDALGFDDGLNDKWRVAVDAHKRHALQQWPLEAVGVIDAEGEYHPCDNIHENPEKYFRVSDEQLRSVDGGRPAAVLHSHTTSPTPTGDPLTTQPPVGPSAADMQSQIDMAVPWGISLCLESGATDPVWFGDQVPAAPLLGRSFRHGRFDCYSFIRDWHKQVAGLVIPDFPRDMSWWEGNGPEDIPQDLYVDNFESAGFRRVHREQGILPGDVFLCRLLSPVINHGGVCIADGVLGHHVIFNLSMRVAASTWRSKLDFLVRHRDLPDSWRPPTQEGEYL